MKLRRLKIEDIIVPPVRVTARMDEETAQQFKESVKELGIDEPVKCFDVDGKFYLSDGLHRLQEAKARGDTYIDATVRPGTMVDVIANNLMSGHLRGKHPISEMIRSIRLLYTDHHVGIEEIVKKTGMTQDYVERLIKISQLTPLILQGLDEGLIGVGQAGALTRIKDPVTQESIYHNVKIYRWKLAELNTFIDDVLAVQSQPATTQIEVQTVTPVLVKCVYCGAEGKPGFIANPNTCPACSQSMFQSMALARQELAAEAAAKTKS